MTFYPRIATAYYKDKNINIKFPIRIKWIEIKKYECKKCNISATESELLNGVGILHIDKHSKYNCPKCKKQLKINKKKLIKLYMKSKFKYIDICAILNSFTLLRWRSRQIVGRPSFEISAFEDSFDKVLSCLEWFRKEKNVLSLLPNPHLQKYLHGKTGFNLRINRKVNMKILKKDFDEYMKRKVANAL